jgi:hypothetical protein
LKIQPLSLTAKFERRTNDYKRSYRMGVMSKDLQKMSNSIKVKKYVSYHLRLPTFLPFLPFLLSRHTVMCWTATGHFLFPMLLTMPLTTASTATQRR